MRHPRSLLLLAVATVLSASSSPAVAGERCAGKALLRLHLVEDVPVCDVTLCTARREERDFLLGMEGCAYVLRREKFLYSDVILLNPGTTSRPPRIAMRRRP